MKIFQSIAGCFVAGAVVASSVMSSPIYAQDATAQYDNVTVSVGAGCAVH